MVRGRTPVMRNGITPIQAVESKVSICNCAGIKGRSISTGTGQCMNRRSCQFMATAHCPVGMGQGRCAVWRNTSSVSLLNREQLDLENQHAVRTDLASGRSLSVGKLGRYH